MAGWERAKRDAITWKKEVDNVLQEKSASEERISHLEAALKECMQQLHFVRQDQERRIHSAVIKASEELEKKRIALNEKLTEATKKIARLDAENSQLHKSLSSKEKTIEELSRYRTRVEADLNALVLRVESTEKEKASLSYEVRVLEKELDIRNEETEFNRRTADIAQKQHQDSAKKIAKLESECLRLRLLVRRRLPGPAALTKMKNEVEMLARTTRRRSNPSDDDPADTPSKRINFLHCSLDNNRSTQFQIPRNVYARAQGNVRIEGSLSPFFKEEQSLAAVSDLGSDDKASCAESWASALISELEHLGRPSNGYMGTTEMDLMDDFAEMEKLAVVSIDYPATSSHHSSEEGNAVIGQSGSPSGGHSLPTIDSEMAQVHTSESQTLISGQEILSENTTANTSLWQLDDLLKMLLEYCRALKISPDEVLEDMKVALKHNSSDSTYFNEKGSKNHLDATTHSPKASRQVSNKSFNLDASDAENANDISTTKKRDQKLESNVSMPICKILELLEGIDILPQDNGGAASFPGEDDNRSPNKSLATPTGYMVRLFQWKSAELSEILQQFLQTCNDMLNGKANLEHFVELVASTLDWVMSHCFSLQDVSSMKDAMRSRLAWDESRSESEFDSGSANYSAESNRLIIQREEAKKLIVEPSNTDLSTIDFGGRAQSQTFKVESFKNQTEKETTVQSIGNAGDQIENWKMMQENHETQFMEAYHEQRNASRMISFPKNDLENTSNPFDRQEETFNDHETLPKSKRSNGGQDDGKLCEKQLRDDWEITAASEKLAECQETILNLGKQLKALASPRDAALFDISTPAEDVITSTPTPKRIVSKRLSLRDNMLAEDSDQIGASPITTDDIQNGNSNSTVSELESRSKLTDSYGINGEADTKAIVSKAIVPRKKKEGKGFLKKLFMWQKKGDRKKTLFS